MSAGAIEAFERVANPSTPAVFSPLNTSALPDGFSSGVTGQQKFSFNNTAIPGPNGGVIILGNNTDLFARLATGGDPDVVAAVANRTLFCTNTDILNASNALNPASAQFLVNGASSAEAFAFSAIFSRKGWNEAAIPSFWVRTNQATFAGNEGITVYAMTGRIPSEGFNTTFGSLLDPQDQIVNIVNYRGGFTCGSDTLVVIPVGNTSGLAMNVLSFTITLQGRANSSTARLIENTIVNANDTGKMQELLTRVEASLRNASPEMVGNVISQMQTNQGSLPARVSGGSVSQSAS